MFRRCGFLQPCAVFETLSGCVRTRLNIIFFLINMCNSENPFKVSNTCVNWYNNIHHIQFECRNYQNFLLNRNPCLQFLGWSLLHNWVGWLTRNVLGESSVYKKCVRSEFIYNKNKFQKTFCTTSSSQQSSG